MSHARNPNENDLTILKGKDYFKYDAIKKIKAKIIEAVWEACEMGYRVQWGVVLLRWSGIP